MKILFGFTETGRFLKRIADRISDEEYAELQLYLCENPSAGDIIQGSGGLRKMRWRIAGKGKSGGIRIIYYWAISREKILMLDIYKKNEKDNLNQSEINLLRQNLENWKQ